MVASTRGQWPDGFLVLGVVVAREMVWGEGLCRQRLRVAAQRVQAFSFLWALPIRTEDETRPLLKARG